MLKTDYGYEMDLNIKKVSSFSQLFRIRMELNVFGNLLVNYLAFDSSSFDAIVHHAQMPSNIFG